MLKKIVEVLKRKSTVPIGEKPARYIMAYKSAQSNVVLGQSSLIKNYKRAVVCIKENGVVYKIISTVPG
jgi:hypothetical protein